MNSASEYAREIEAEAETEGPNARVNRIATYEVHDDKCKQYEKLKITQGVDNGANESNEWQFEYTLTLYNMQTEHG